MAEPFLEVHPTLLKEWMDQNKPIQIIDVREPWEFEKTHLPKSCLVPLSNFDQQDFSRQFSKDDWIVVVCHHGVRSLRTTRSLHEMGFQNVYSLQGGLDQWSREVDPSFPTY